MPIKLSFRGNGRRNDKLSQMDKIAAIITMLIDNQETSKKTIEKLIALVDSLTLEVIEIKKKMIE